jgi:hypothetical protein
MRGIGRTASWDRLAGLCHEIDWPDCAMRWNRQTVSWDGLGGPCHEMDWADCFMGWIGRSVSWDGFGRTVSWDGLGRLYHEMDCLLVVRNSYMKDMRSCFLIVSTPNLQYVTMIRYPASRRICSVLKPDKHLFSAYSYLLKVIFICYLTKTNSFQSQSSSIKTKFSFLSHLLWQWKTSGHSIQEFF